MTSSVLFPGVWSLYADVSEHSICSIFIGSADPPPRCHPPSYWLRLFSSQTFSRINNQTFLNLVILHTHPPMKMEQSVPKRRNIKFRPREITQKKAYNIHKFFGGKYCRHLHSDVNISRPTSAPIMIYFCHIN